GNDEPAAPWDRRHNCRVAARAAGNAAKRSADSRLIRCPRIEEAMTYRVSFPDATRDRLEALTARAIAVGLGRRLGRLLSQILQDLTERPLEAGETMYHLEHSQLPVKVMAKD